MVVLSLFPNVRYIAQKKSYGIFYWSVWRLKSDCVSSVSHLNTLDKGSPLLCPLVSGSSWSYRAHSVSTVCLKSTWETKDSWAKRPRPMNNIARACRLEQLQQSGSMPLEQRKKETSAQEAGAGRESKQCSASWAEKMGTSAWVYMHSRKKEPLPSTVYSGSVHGIT